MTRPLHIAHVLRKYDAKEIGGTETHVAEITRRMQSRGVTCEVHAPYKHEAGEDEPQPLAVPLVRYRAHCPFLASPAKRRALWANAGNLLSFEEPLRLALDSKISLVHLHTAGRIGGGARLAMRLTRRPYLVSVHGPMLSGTDFLQADLQRRSRGTVDLGKPFGMLVGARRVLDDAARLICFNDDEQRALQKKFGAKVLRMDHGVDRSRFAGGDVNRGRSRWPALGAAGLVLQIGRLCEQKDQLLGLRAFAAGAPPDYKLAFAGAETDRGYQAMLEKEAAKLGIDGRVHYLGNVEPRELPDLVAMSTLCLAPSQHEAFGLLVLEAWAAGKPILFARLGGMEDLANALGENAPALSDRAPQTWASALKALLADPQLRARAAAAGGKLLDERFSWDRAADKLIGVYREVIEERARSAA